jgi:hypothetical protein
MGENTAAPPVFVRLQKYQITCLLSRQPKIVPPLEWAMMGRKFHNDIMLQNQTIHYRVSYI